MANGDPWKCLGPPPPPEGTVGSAGCASVLQKCHRGMPRRDPPQWAGRWAGRMAAGCLLPISLYAQNWPRNLLMACLWGCANPGLLKGPLARPGNGDLLQAGDYHSLLHGVCFLSILTDTGNQSANATPPPPSHPATHPRFEISLAPNAPRFLAGVCPNSSAP